MKRRWCPLVFCLALALLSAWPSRAQQGSCDFPVHEDYLATDWPEDCQFDPVLGIAAFDGAQGYGAVTAGGRCGRVVVITDCSTDAQLREAIDPPTSLCDDALGEPDPRVVLFNCSGVIPLSEPLTLEGECGSHVTIAGHTAPGDGVMLTGFALNLLNAHDVGIRHLRLRNQVHVDDYPEPGQTDLGCGIGLRGAQRIVVANSSISWSTDEALSAEFGTAPSESGCNQQITFQDNQVGEVLFNGEHPSGMFHSRGMVASNGSFDVSAFRNYVVSNYARNPSLQGRETPQCGNCPQQLLPSHGVQSAEFNVAFNWASKDGDADQEGFGIHFAQGADCNIRGNLLREGPDSIETVAEPYTFPIEAQDRCCDVDTDFYVAENCEILRDPVTGFDTLHCPEAETEDPIVLVDIEDALPFVDRSLVPLGDPPDFAVTGTPEGEPDLATYVLNKAGALPHDYWDEEFFADWRAWDGDVGAVIPLVFDLGKTHLQIAAQILEQPPEIGTAWADADLDGVPDNWETSPPAICPNAIWEEGTNDALDDTDGNGYSDLEDYLDCLDAQLKDFHADEFEDGVRPPDFPAEGGWTYAEGEWTEEGGELVGERPAGEDTKARAIARNTLDCELCRFEATLRATSPTPDKDAADDVHARLLGWYVDANSNVSLTLEVFESLVRVQQKVNGQVTGNGEFDLPEGISTIEPDVDYDVMMERTFNSFGQPKFVCDPTPACAAEE